MEMLRKQLRLRNDHILAQRKSLPSEHQGQLPGQDDASEGTHHYYA